ncbi:MAG: type II secretion system F family protein, partial [Paracoccaceae bacterium]
TLGLWGVSPQTLVIVGVALGCLMVILGVSGSFAVRDPVLQRIAQQSLRRRPSGVEAGLLRSSDADPKGLMRSLIPADRKERSQIQRRMAEAGVTGRNGLRNFYLVRLGFGFVLPGVLIGLIALSRTGFLALPEPVATKFGALSQTQILMMLSVLVAAGFFGPVYWLNGKVNARRQAISDSFPNVLDLLQISVESGLGLDAAMIRVANETTATAPAISEELLIAQREIQAGRGRDKALLDMAARTGVAEVSSFANVVLQSLQYGSSISDALTVYSDEMRLSRELRAQEMANKLPVKMSAVMASLMLPTLLMLALGPVVIRYIRYMHG